MKLLSIDIGIKNMGICLFEIINNEFNIIEWNILDLLCIYKCCAENCSKPIKFYKNNLYYCKTHAKKNDMFCIPPDDMQNFNKILSSHSLYCFHSISNRTYLVFN